MCSGIGQGEGERLGACSYQNRCPRLRLSPRDSNIQQPAAAAAPSPRAAFWTASPEPSLWWRYRSKHRCTYTGCSIGRVATCLVVSFFGPAAVFIPPLSSQWWGLIGWGCHLSILPCMQIRSRAGYPLRGLVQVGRMFRVQDEILKQNLFMHADCGTGLNIWIPCGDLKGWWLKMSFLLKCSEKLKWSNLVGPI